MKNKTTMNDTVREALGIALLQLMEAKPFHHITISEIAAVAGVSRNSFYRNFSDKEHLLSDYITTLYRSFFQVTALPCFLNDAIQMRDFLVPRFRFVKEHRNIYKVLHQQGLLYSFFQQTEKDLILLFCGQDETLPPYYRAMLSGACAGIVRAWIESDFHESEETMALLFSEPFHSVLAAPR